MQLNEIKIGGRYLMGPQIGAGSFGEVHLAVVPGEDQIYALKKEDQRSKNPQLMAETRLLKAMDRHEGFPKLFWTGTECHSTLMIMELLGPSLEDLFVLCGRKFTIKTTLMLAQQMVSRLESLHEAGYIHRDVKPDNFLMGLAQQSHCLYIIDFGLSKYYKDPKTQQHIPYRENKTLAGTARYASINTHLGIEHSRRDDMEAVGYMLVYFMQGFLQWQGIKANNKLEKYQKIMEKKMSVPVETQCKGLPVEFPIFLSYCRSLKFEDTPDYSYCRGLFVGLLQRLNLEYDYMYDWCTIQVARETEQNRVRIQINPRSIEGDNIISYPSQKGLPNQSQKKVPSHQKEAPIVFAAVSSQSLGNSGMHAQSFNPQLPTALKTSLRTQVRGQSVWNGHEQKQNDFEPPSDQIEELEEVPDESVGSTGGPFLQSNSKR